MGAHENLQRQKNGLMSPLCLGNVPCVLRLVDGHLEGPPSQGCWLAGRLIVRVGLTASDELCTHSNNLVHWFNGAPARKSQRAVGVSRAFRSGTGASSVRSNTVVGSQLSTSACCGFINLPNLLIHTTIEYKSRCQREIWVRGTTRQLATRCAMTVRAARDYVEITFAELVRRLLERNNVISGEQSTEASLQFAGLKIRPSYHSSCTLSTSTTQIG